MAAVSSMEDAARRRPIAEDGRRSVAEDLGVLREQARALNAQVQRQQARTAHGQAMLGSIPPVQQDFHQMLSSLRGIGRDVPEDDDAVRMRAQRLLSTRNFDTEQAARAVHTLDVMATYEPVDEGATTVAGFLEHHHDMMICTAIDEARESTYAECDAALERHLDADWKRARQQLMTSLGLMVTNGEPADRGGATPSRALAAPATPGGFTPAKGRGATSGALPFTPITASSAIFGGVGGAPPPVDVVGPVPLSAAVNVPPPRAPAADVAPLASVVSDMVRSRRDGTPEIVPVAERFMLQSEQLAKSHGRSRAAVHIWELVRFMTRDKRYEPAHRHDGGRTEDAQRFFAAGSVRFLEKQYLEHLQSQTKGGGRGGDSPILSAVRGWIDQQREKQKETWRSWYGAQQHKMVRGYPLWPQVFLCFRCGGYDEAQALLQEAGERQAELAFCAFAEMLATAFTKETPPDCPREAIEAMRREFSELRDSHVDPFEAEMYNMLGFVRPRQRTRWSDVPLPHVEDYLWQKLVFALCSPLWQASSAAAGDKSMGKYSIADVADIMVRKGADFFDPSGKAPFRFPQILLLCGEFERAIDFLVSRSRHPQCAHDAVHLALCLHYYGALSVDFARESFDSRGPAGAAAESESWREGYLVRRDDRRGGPASVQLDVVGLISWYVSAHLTSNAGLAAEYVCILEDDDACKDILRQLLHRTRAYDLLVGRLSGDLVPLEGHLHKICPPDFVADLIDMSAKWAKDNGRFLDALVLFLRSESLRPVADLLITQLAELLVPATGASGAQDERKAWSGFADEVYNHVIGRYFREHPDDDDILKRLVDTLLLLLDLHDFVDLVKAGQCSRALELLDKLEMLPLDPHEESHSRMAPGSHGGELAEERVINLDLRLRDRFFLIVELAMECLYQLYEHARHERNPDREAHFRARASALISFHASLRKYGSSLGADTSMRLARYEVLFT